MSRLLLVLLLLTGVSLAAGWNIAIRVKGTVEVSPDGQSWSGLIRNRTLTDQGFARTLADSLGQVRSEDGSLYVMGPSTTVKLQVPRLSLQEGALRLEGCVKVATRLGTVESEDPTLDGYLVDRGPKGMLCEVFEGWIRIRGTTDVDGGERAVWDEKSFRVEDGDLKAIPAELQPAPED